MLADSWLESGIVAAWSLVVVTLFELAGHDFEQEIYTDGNPGTHVLYGRREEQW